MSKIIKIIIGTILLGISAFYLVGICMVVADAKEDAVYSLHSYIEVEQKDCEYLGRNPVVYGREKQADDGYGFYKITFEARNLSSEPYYGRISDILDIDRGMDGKDVGLEIFPRAGSSLGYIGTVEPAFPGKATIELVYYLEVKEGIERVNASYLPSWEEEEIELDIVLN